jgi:hypothetical protein
MIPTPIKLDDNIGDFMDGNCCAPHPASRIEKRRIQSFRRLGGLHHRYAVAA